MTVTDCTITGNTAAIGGGIWNPGNVDGDRLDDQRQLRCRPAAGLPAPAWPTLAELDDQRQHGLAYMAAALPISPAAA